MPVSSGKRLFCVAHLPANGRCVTFTSHFVTVQTAGESHGEHKEGSARVSCCVPHVVIYIDADHISDSHAEGVTMRAFKGWYKSHLSHVRRILE